MTDALTLEQAVELDEMIQEEISLLSDLVLRAWRGRIWLPLGFTSWADYAADRKFPFRFDTKAERLEVVAELTSEGMSIPAIADALGVGVGTVHRDQSSAFPDGKPEATIGTDGKTYRRPTRDHEAEDAAFESYLHNSVAVRAGTDDPDEVLAYHLKEVAQQHQMDQAIAEYRAGLQELMRKLREDTKHSGYGIREYGTNSLKPWREEAEEILEDRTDTSAEDISELVEWGKYLSLFAEYLITRGESRLKELS